MYSACHAALMETLGRQFALSKSRLLTLAVLIMGLAQSRTVNLIFAGSLSESSIRFQRASIHDAQAALSWASRCFAGDAVRRENVIASPASISARPASTARRAPRLSRWSSTSRIVPGRSCNSGTNRR